MLYMNYVTCHNFAVDYSFSSRTTILRMFAMAKYIEQPVSAAVWLNDCTSVCICVRITQLHMLCVDTEKSHSPPSSKFHDSASRRPCEWLGWLVKTRPHALHFSSRGNEWSGAFWQVFTAFILEWVWSHLKTQSESVLSKFLAESPLYLVRIQSKSNKILSKLPCDTRAGRFKSEKNDPTLCSCKKRMQS